MIPPEVLFRKSLFALLERFCGLCDEPCSALVTCLKLLASGP